jgi:hypothetical protein
MKTTVAVAATALKAHKNHWVTANDAHVSEERTSRANGGYVKASWLRVNVKAYGL